MSGSGPTGGMSDHTSGFGPGGGFSGGLGGGAIGENFCISVAEQTPLNSPVPHVISSLRVGDFLDLQIQGTPSRPILVAIDTKTSSVAGSVTFRNLPNLLNCISNGHQYIAEILSLSGGSCVVLIRHK